MKKFGVSFKMIYNGYKEIEAENEEEAIKKATSLLETERNDFAEEGYLGKVFFGFDNATVDCAEEL